MPKWVCSPGNLTTKSECLPICGDGFVIEDENCDSGKLPGCSPGCMSGALAAWTC